MKKVIFTPAIVLMLMIFTMSALAQVNVTLNYTADNEITAFYYKMEDYTVIPLPLGPGAAWWPTVDSYSATIETYEVHEFIWEIQNWFYHDPNFNPGGFLAEIQPADKLVEDYFSSSSLSGITWDVYVSPTGSIAPNQFYAIPWSPATTYGANNSPTIWNLNLAGPVSGISDAAQWIWGPDNFGDPGAPLSTGRVYVRANVFAHAPEPGTVVLLGSGLLGLGFFGWWRRKKKA